jgi:hypothetical protein
VSLPWQQNANGCNFGVYEAPGAPSYLGMRLI